MSAAHNDTILFHNIFVAHSFWSLNSLLKKYQFLVSTNIAKVLLKPPHVFGTNICGILPVMIVFFPT